MTWLRGLVLRLMALFRKRRLEQELDEELRSHLEMQIEENVRKGMPAREARYAALRSFGGVEQVKELYRGQRGLPMIETLIQDVRFGLRMHVRNPGFTAVAVLTLALGIGANTLIFSIVNAVVFQRLPFEGADRLVMVAETNARGRLGGVSPANFLDWRSQSRQLEQVSAKVDWIGCDLTGSGEAEQVIGVAVSAGIFPLLKVKPVLGRVFLPEEDHPGAAPVVVLSDRLWQQRFKGDPNALGEILTVNGTPHIIIGVMPAGFYLNRDTMNISETDQLWVPLAQQLSAVGISMSQRHIQNLRVWARLKSGVSIEQAQAEMDIIQQRIQQEYPPDNRDRGVRLLPLREWQAERVRPVYGLLAVLLGAVGCVLLIACANVANLQLARVVNRTQEVAIRLSLGAGRLRLVRQLLTESLLLAGLGAAVALLLAYWGIYFLSALVPDNLRIPRLDQLVIDRRVLGFTVLLTLLSSVMCGLAPACQSLKANLQEALKAGARSATEGSRGRRFQSVLVTSELALALVLLIAAGLLMRSFVQLLKLDPGLDSRSVLTLKIPAPDRPENINPADVQRRERFVRELMERLQGFPGVHSVGVVDRLPLSGSRRLHRFTIEGSTSPLAPQAVTHVVSAGYFRTLGIPLKRGRIFDNGDVKGAPAVAVINEAMARRYWPNEDPIGKRIRQEGPDSNQIWCTVKGIVGDVKENPLASETEPEVYWSHLQMGTDFMETTLVIRTEPDPRGLIPVARNEIAALDKNQPVSQIRTMEEVVSNSVSPQRFYFALIGVLAAIALFLAAAGVYGVMAYSVSQRTHEIGVRMALGAQRRDVLHLVVGQGILLAAIGAVIGIVAAMGLTRYLESLLYGVGATDPMTFAGAAILLLLVAFSACYVPARRATKVDPMVALRYE